MTEQEVAAREILRGYILASGRDDWVSMASVRGCVSREKVPGSAIDHKRIVVDTVRSLLTEGLIEVGDIPGREDHGFMPWPGSVDDVMAQFIDRFVEHHDDRLGWEYTIWFNLTPAGEEASSQLIRNELKDRAER